MVEWQNDKMAEWQNDMTEKYPFTKKDFQKRKRKKELMKQRYNYICFSSSFLFFPLLNLSSMFFCVSQKKILHEKNGKKGEKKISMSITLEKKGKKKKDLQFTKNGREIHTPHEIFKFEPFLSLPSCHLCHLYYTQKKDLNHDVG